MMLGFLLLGVLRTQHPETAPVQGLILLDDDSASRVLDTSRQASIVSTPREGGGGLQLHGGDHLGMLGAPPVLPGPAEGSLPTSDLRQRGAAGPSSPSSSSIMGAPLSTVDSSASTRAPATTDKELFHVQGHPVVVGGSGAASGGHLPTHSMGEPRGIHSHSDEHDELGINDLGTLTAQAKTTVQMYLMLKTFMSLLLALMVGMTLCLVNIDFWFVFTVGRTKARLGVGFLLCGQLHPVNRGLPVTYSQTPLTPGSRSRSTETERKERE